MLLIYLICFVVCFILNIIFPDNEFIQQTYGEFTVVSTIIVLMLDKISHKLSRFMDAFKQFDSTLSKEKVIQMSDEQFLDWIKFYNKDCEGENVVYTDDFETLVKIRQKYKYSDKPISYYRDIDVKKDEKKDSNYIVKFEFDNNDSFSLSLSRDDLNKLNDREGLPSCYDGDKTYFEFRFKSGSATKEVASIHIIYAEGTDTIEKSIVTEENIKTFFETIRRTQFGIQLD